MQDPIPHSQISLTPEEAASQSTTTITHDQYIYIRVRRNLLQPIQPAHLIKGTTQDIGRYHAGVSVPSLDSSSPLTIVR